VKRLAPYMSVRTLHRSVRVGLREETPGKGRQHKKPVRRASSANYELCYLHQ
jgi:hypothetical protein